MQLSIRHLGLFLGAVIGLNSQLAFAADGWQTAIGIHFSSGEYGKEQETDMISLPLSVSYRKGAWQTKVVIPWVSVDGPGNVDNAPVVVTSTVTTEKEIIRAQQSLLTKKETGLGDIWLSTKYRAPKKILGWWWDGVGKIKLPTADEDKGLGTGARDFKFVWNGLRPFKKGYLLLDLGYKIRGDADVTSKVTSNEEGETLVTEQLSLDNSAVFALGYYQRVKGLGSAAVMYEYKEASHRSKTDPQELLFFNSWKLSKSFKLSNYVAFGLSDGAADYSLGTTIKFSH